MTNRYSEYKDSGIEWVGQIPKHWIVKPLFSITKLTSVSECEDKELLSVYLDKGVIKFSDVNEKRTNATSEDLSKYQLVMPGNLVLNNQQAWRGSVGVSKFEGIVSPAYIVLELSNEIDPIYANYIFRDSSMVSFYLISSKGVGTIQRNLYWPQLKRAIIAIPPLPEQTAIAAFLDRKTALIDKAIAIKQKQIELLKERRQILIQRAVTRGLNPNAKMKDSGVEWIGEIPEGWEVKKLRYLATSFPSNIDKHSKPNEKKVRLCNYTDVYKNDYITDDMELMIATASAEQIAKYTLLEGDIVITKDSETASDIAVPTYIKEKLTNVVCGYHLAIIRTYQKSYSKYLFHALKTKLFNAQFEVCSNGITRVGLGNSDLKNGYFLFPTEFEQIKISEFIEDGTSKIATAISLKEQDIEKIKEYKATLINEVVTGKVKVC